MLLKTFTVSETVVVDARTNRASIINISEEYQAPRFPFVAGNLTALALFEREGKDSEQYAARLEIRCGDNLVLQGSISIEFSGLQRTRAVIEIGTFEVTECDYIDFDLVVGDERIARWSVSVRIVEEERAATPSAPDEAPAAN